ncbi:MAG: undecaprenyl-diphosphate phosphatase [Candidatus Parcubacteria bacterium]|nr:MAG: undecaprenyl-diphosphatase UppP [Candidatus Parcubacteria bacterium]
MTIWQSLIMGIVEGFTEFLPISSTAHLIITSELLKIPTTDFLKTFNISIQLGAILAVVILYWKKIWSSWSLIGKIIAATIPTAILGLALYEVVKNFLMESLPLIAGSLFIGGIIIILFERWYARKKPTPQSQSKEVNDISYKQAVILGATQSLAMVPGVSRSGATIIGGLVLGISRHNIVEFSFLLAIPTMIGATALDIYKSPSLFTSDQLVVWLVGFITAFITAVIGVKFLIRYVQRNDFQGFAWYRIIFGALIFLFLI